MKRYSFLLLLMLTYMGSNAQDIILTKSSQKIDAKIIEVSKSEIKYKEADNLDGPLFVLPVEDIHSIIYSNGKVKLYNQEQTDKVPQYPTNMAPESASPTSSVSTSSKQAKDLRGVYHEWHEFLDYINIEQPIDITNYTTLFIFPPDLSSVTYPERNDSRYPALVNALYSFPIIIKEELQRRFPYVDIVLLHDTIVPSKDKSAVLRLKIDRLEMGEKVSTKIQGYGGGVHTIQISGNVRDADMSFFSFEQKRISIRRDYYEKILKKEFDNFAGDIARIFETFKEEM